VGRKALEIGWNGSKKRSSSARASFFATINVTMGLYYARGFQGILPSCIG
jgi:hypothetical protein